MGLPYAASSGNSGGAAINLQGIGLTASHKKIIYDKIIGERSQSLPDDQQLAVGKTIPDFSHAQYHADRG